MYKKTIHQDAQTIQNAENAASVYCNLVKEFKNYVLYKYDGSSNDKLNKMRTEIITARKKITECKNIIDQDANDKSLREYSYGRKIDSGKVDEYDDFLRKFDFSYKEYKVIKVEPYIPESIEEVFSKKYDKKSDLLGDSNTQTSGEETHE